MGAFRWPGGLLPHRWSYRPTRTPPEGGWWCSVPRLTGPSRGWCCGSARRPSRRHNAGEKVAGTGSLMFDLSARSVGRVVSRRAEAVGLQASGHSLRVRMGPGTWPLRALASQGLCQAGRWQSPAMAVPYTRSQAADRSGGGPLLPAFLTGDQSTLPQPLWHREREAPWWEPPSYGVVTKPFWGGI